MVYSDSRNTDGVRRKQTKHELLISRISIHAPLTGCDSKHAEFSSSYLRISNKIRLSVTTLSPSLVALILLYDILPTFSSANAASFHAGLHFASHYQRPLGFVAALCAVMFNFCIIFVSKIVKCAGCLSPHPLSSTVHAEAVCIVQGQASTQTPNFRTR
mgnify:CR=1 FL=1